MHDPLQDPAGDGRPPAFRLADYEFTVACCSDGLADVIGSLFAACRTERAAPHADAFEIRASRGSDGANVELRVLGERLARGSAGVVIDRLIWETSNRSFAQGELLFVHAGVASLDGVGVMLPAAPEHGKSTTVAGLVHAGFDFLSDEAAAIDLNDGTVRCFPRPLMLSPSSLAALPHLGLQLDRQQEPLGSDGRRMAPDDLRPGALATTARVAFIVSPDYRAGAVTRLEPMGRPDMLRLLVEQSFNLRRVGADGFRVLADVVRRAECYRLTIGDLPTAVREVRGLFDGKQVEAS